ncbi:YeeE/YedE thiosulfate transporter family protein [Asaia sp. HN010]|uniref:YeeE/YedE family protein n=1 Tax=Asaia sp. HN010 TaxID=3081233 RepID=UPI00301B0781
MILSEPNFQGLAGGLLIGLSCAAYLLLTGRSVGISGMVAGLFAEKSSSPDTTFLLGLIVGPLLWRLVWGVWPPITIHASFLTVVISGLLVGFGTRLGNGCTSGHGVMGMARLSPRSLIAVVTFLAVGASTATLFHLLTGSVQP